MPPTDALRSLAPTLRCPHCAGSLRLAGNTLACAHRHSFDVARQGYVNLLTRAAPANADTPEMVRARAAFLNAGHYLPIARAVAAAVGDAERVLETGAGTGYYLAQVLDARPGATGLATDVSPAAARIAARAHPRLASVVADTWAGVPVADEVFDALLCVFAPRNPAEFSRVLRPGGALAVVVPTATHLAGLRDDYGLLGVPSDKAAAVARAFADWPSRVERVEADLDLSADEVARLIAMGPNAFHGVPESTAPAGTRLSVDVVRLTRPT
ncbi:MAG TPA: methyltransferase domain-containing protein [Arachnia sp.]|nr:methyltransferase domain-containing protein [Arachnia sp.]HMT85667.1 methyltransferase domain-containing protein [Arachnia sp.]